MSELNLMWMFGAIAALAFIAGLFFLRFAVIQRDRFFVWFALAFWLLGSSWGVHVFSGGPGESGAYVYLLRAAGYLLIIFAIVDKNRRR
jgi:hypothetical protein